MCMETCVDRFPIQKPERLENNNGTYKPRTETFIVFIRPKSSNTRTIRNRVQHERRSNDICHPGQRSNRVEAKAITHTDTEQGPTRSMGHKRAGWLRIKAQDPSCVCIIKIRNLFALATPLNGLRMINALLSQESPTSRPHQAQARASRDGTGQNERDRAPTEVKSRRAGWSTGQRRALEPSKI